MQIENLDQYQALAARTMKEEGKDRMIVHCVMGMMGEAGELDELTMEDELKRVGEAGDCLWYVANLFRILQTPLQEEHDRIITSWGSSQGLTTNPNRELLRRGCALIDYVKKSIFYEKPLDYALVGVMANDYLSALMRVCLLWGLNLPDAAVANIKKLEKRYPNMTFNASHAINRDVAAEMVASGLSEVKA